MAKTRSWTKEQLESAIVKSFSYAGILRELGLAGAGSRGAIKKAVAFWGLDVSHFLTRKEMAGNSQWVSRRVKIPLSEILVEHSPYSRGHLKERLFAEGMKQHKCEMCGQGEEWHGKKMALILDHVNGIRDDNRFENIRIVCPNCNSTLPTFAGRNIKKNRRAGTCPVCYKEVSTNKYCSKECAVEAWGRPRLNQRRVVRPDAQTLMAEVNCLGYLATGRKYGVSDNSVRKWVRSYKKQTAPPWCNSSIPLSDSGGSGANPEGGTKTTGEIQILAVPESTVQ